jgi:hypothetical protein
MAPRIEPAAAVAPNFLDVRFGMRLALMRNTSVLSAEEERSLLTDTNSRSKTPGSLSRPEGCTATTFPVTCEPLGYAMWPFAMIGAVERLPNSCIIAAEIFAYSNRKLRARRNGCGTGRCNKTKIAQSADIAVNVRFIRASSNLSFWVLPGKLA